MASSSGLPPLPPPPLPGPEDFGAAHLAGILVGGEAPQVRRRAVPVVQAGLAALSQEW